MDGDPLRSANILAQSLVEKLASDPAAADELKANPSQIKDLASTAVKTADTGTRRALDASTVALDASVYRIVVSALGVAVVGSVFSILVIAIVTILRHDGSANINLSIPDGLVAVASAAVGALAGLLTPVSRNVGPPPS